MASRARAEIVGKMIFYDESPTWLMAAVTAMAPALDHLVAVDGSYFLFPGSQEHPNSPLEQTEAIFEACNAVDLPLTLHRPTRPFEGNEVEKRQLALDLALLHAVPEEGWILIFDADCVAFPIKRDIRHDLRGAGDILVAEYGAIESHDFQKMEDNHEIAPGVDYSRLGKQHVRAIFRAVKGLSYGPAHWTLYAPRSNGEVIWLWGNPMIHTPYVHDVLDLSSTITVEHRKGKREMGRYQRARDYYQRRDTLGIEDATRVHVQGLDGDWKVVSRGV